MRRLLGDDLESPVLHLHLADAGGELLAEATRRASLHEKEVCKPFTIAEKKLLLELLGRFRSQKA
ncbi:MAG: hypothetical protein Q8O52_29895 [Sulfuritalea sp.]|nr:hypothetical protein [Sulfuritalea sp.]